MTPHPPTDDLGREVPLTPNYSHYSVMLDDLPPGFNPEVEGDWPPYDPSTCSQCGKGDDEFELLWYDDHGTHLHQDCEPIWAGDAD
jgi:hypothetical protein